MAWRKRSHARHSSRTTGITVASERFGCVFNVRPLPLRRREGAHGAIPCGAPRFRRNGFGERPRPAPCAYEVAYAVVRNAQALICALTPDIYGRMEIIKRGRGRPRQDACKRGHPLSGENVYVAPTGERSCRACQHERHAIWRDVNRVRWNEIAKASKRRTRARRRASAENNSD